MARHLGITFQQIQKYEKGTNRIGASRLQHIAQGADRAGVLLLRRRARQRQSSRAAWPKRRRRSYVVDFLSSSEGIQLNKAFVRIKDAKLRRRVIDLVRAMAGADDEDGLSDSVASAISLQSRALPCRRLARPPMRSRRDGVRRVGD